ncbi:MAG: hypothetical protein WHV66_05905 [Anaerolineales bacterium]
MSDLLPGNQIVKLVACDIKLEVRVILFSLRDRQLQVLLAPAGENQAMDLWQLPGNLVDRFCSLEETASMCLVEYIGCREAYLEQLYTYGYAEEQLVSVVYYALIPGDIYPEKKHTPSQWFPVDTPPVLISNHAEILQYALRRLRYKLEYTAVGFELLPDHFTLSELQSTYEIVLGEKLDKRNFRRRILKADVIEPTPHQRCGEGRPARLFRYRPDAVAEVKARRLFP